MYPGGSVGTPVGVGEGDGVGEGAPVPTGAIVGGGPVGRMMKTGPPVDAVGVGVGIGGGVTGVDAGCGV